MRPAKLHRTLARKIQNFIRLRRLSGTDYQSQAQLPGYFDRFLLTQRLNEPRMTREITDGYQQSLFHLAPRTRYNRFSVVRQFCEYLAMSDPRSYVPEPLRVIPSPTAHPPYIYTPSELQALLAAASKLPPPNSLRPHAYRTLPGVLYSTGIRIGEALALNLEDFHSAESRLYIAEGKFRKARWVPLSASTCRALQPQNPQCQTGRDPRPLQLYGPGGTHPPAPLPDHSHHPPKTHGAQNGRLSRREGNASPPERGEPHLAYRSAG